MNGLSWLIYASDVLSTLKCVVAIFTFGSLVIFGMWKFLVAMDCEEEMSAACNSRFVKTLPWIVAGAIVFSVLPTQNTVLAIAASEVGEMIAKKPEVEGLATDTLRALRSWIEKQTKS